MMKIQIFESDFGMPFIGKKVPCRIKRLSKRKLKKRLASEIARAYEDSKVDLNLR